MHRPAEIVREHGAPLAFGLDAARRGRFPLARLLSAGAAFVVFTSRAVRDTPGNCNLISALRRFASAGLQPPSDPARHRAFEQDCNNTTNTSKPGFALGGASAALALILDLLGAERHPRADRLPACTLVVEGQADLGGDELTVRQRELALRRRNLGGASRSGISHHVRRAAPAKPAIVPN